MGLSSIVSKTGLAFYAEVALIIFFAVFVGVVIHTFQKSRRKEHEQAARIPLDDHVPVDDREDSSEAMP